MPQGRSELHAYFRGTEKPIAFLEGRGYRLTPGWEWRLPDFQIEPTDEEYDALEYLFDEWDFGWLAR